MKPYQYWIIIGLLLSLSIYFGVRLQHACVPSEELQREINTLLEKEKQRTMFVDSLEMLIRNRDTAIVERIKYVPQKINSIYSLSMDSSWSLFQSWNRQFEDSAYKAGYFRFSTP
jgi:hypothetical protein